jgi:hypothetical protein
MIWIGLLMAKTMLQRIPLKVRHYSVSKNARTGTRARVGAILERYNCGFSSLRSKLFEALGIHLMFPPPCEGEKKTEIVSTIHEKRKSGHDE